MNIGITLLCKEYFAFWFNAPEKLYHVMIEVYKILRIPVLYSLKKIVMLLNLTFEMNCENEVKIKTHNF